MKNRINQRLEEITETTLIVGVDISKATHWARFANYRGIEEGKAIAFKSDHSGFESIVARIEEICGSKVLRCSYDKIIIGMEPTGHYWKTFANYLIKAGYKVVCVNPAHTKKAKELDDNSQTASDKKDAITIARLMKDGRYFEPYLPQDIYAELRMLSSTRFGVIRRKVSIKNTIMALLDEYFPEIFTVWDRVLEAKSSRQILKSCPFPSLILEMGEDGVLAEIKNAAMKTVGIKKVRKLMDAAKNSVGAGYGLESARLRLRILIEELEMYERHIAEVESAMEQTLDATGYAQQILSIKGMGIVTAASFLGEVGDPLRFQSPRQIANYAGYNLVEDSSGKNKSKTRISKRGRGQLRALLHQMSFSMAGNNTELNALYKHLTSRSENPLKKKQALVVISKKIITIIHTLLKKQETYNSERVLGPVRLELMNAA